ncbi:MAG: IPT/TIG domain-containing protein [Proteobacteria bacterium]|nr:IPT/TIG domain-containing protein [Pseudomonadota bacterium]
MGGSLRKGRGPVAAWLLQLFAAMLLLCSGSAFAQSGTTMTVTGSSPATFSAAGQTLTIQMTLWTGNTPIDGVSFSSGSPDPITSVTCPGGDIMSSVTCSFTYTTTDMDVALGRVLVLGRWVATRPSGGNRSGNTNTFFIPYQAVSAPVANSVSATVAYGSSNNPITLNITGGAPTSVAVGTQATHGTATATGTSITYTPVAGYAGADSFTYTATNASDTSSPATISITVSPPPAPTVTSLSPTNGPTAGNNTVVITGTGFAAASPSGAVKFGAANASYTINSNTQITATAPANAAGTYDVTVTTPGGTSATSAADQYTYVAAPTVTSISPTSGPVAGGTTVVITGTGFAAASPSGAVKFGATNATYTINSNTQITATTPANAAGTYDVTVTTPGGTSATSAADQYTYVAVPTVTSISPNSGLSTGGTFVVITGTNFTGVTAVTFGGTAATGFTVNSTTKITATSPAGSGTVDIRVTTVGGTSATSVADRFTYIAPPVANNVSASVAHGSTNNPITLNITGGVPISVAVGTQATHGTATAAGTSITYTPTASYSGSDSFTYTATNSAGTSAPATVTITVSNATITYAPTSPPAATVAASYSQSLAGASGGTASYTYTVASGSLPPGITLNTNGQLSGTPTAGGSFNFTVQAQDSSTGNGPFNATSGTLTLMVGAPTISVSPASLSNGAIAAAYSQTVTASGGTSSYSYAVTAGVLPTGLTLSAGGVLSGTPTAGGTFNFTVTATDSSTGTGAPYTGSQSYALTIGAPTISVSPASLPNAMAETAYSQTITASGGTATYTYSLQSGSLPAGMSLSSGGVLSGTPTVAGTFNFTIKATDSSTGTGAPFSASQAYSLVINAPAISVSPTTLPNATGGVAYSQTITASGGAGGYTYSLSAGALPPGVALSSAGVLSGTPTTASSYNFTVTATDGHGFTGSQAYTLAINAPTITLTPATVPGATVGVAYSQTMTASGGNGGYTYSLTAGALPPGVSLSSAGVLSGTPTAPGNYNFTVKVTDGFGFSGSQAYTVAVTAPTITLTPPTLPAATVGIAYSQAMAANGGTGPYTYSLVTGSLPTGVSLSSAGVLSGTTTTAGTFNFTVKATDAFGSSGSIAVSITVAAATQAITNFKANPTAPVFAPNGTFTVSATGGASTSPVVFASTTPAVCTVSGSTVTMLAAGNCALTANQAADANYLAAPQVALNVTITAATQAITNFKANPTAPVFAPNGTFTVSATGGASTSPVVFASTTPAVCTVSGSTVTMLAAGNCALTANQAADANYLAAPQVALNVAIAAAAPAISWIGAIHKTQGEAAFDLPLPTSNSAGAFTFTSSNTSVATVSGRTVTIVGGGTATLTATQAATANYTAGSVAATLTVDMRPDPTKDPSVAAGLQAQVDASLRFASAQENNVNDRLRQLRNQKGTPSHNGLTLSVGGGRYGQGMSLPMGLGAAGNAGPGINGGWLGGSIVYGQRNGTTGREGYDLRSDGISFGIDHAFGDYVLGAALGSGWGNTDFSDGRSKQDARHRAFTLYGLWRGNEHWYAEGLMGWGQLDFDLQRWSTVANAMAAARRKGDQQYGSFSVGYTQRNEAYDLTGYGRVEGSRTTLDAYRENGLGIYDLAYRSQRIETSLAAVGVEGSYHGKLGRHAFRPFWSLEYRDALSNSGNAELNYVVQPTAGDYLLALHGYADRTFAFGGGFDLELARGWQMSFQYRREQANGLYNNVFGLRVVFGQGGAAPAFMLMPAQYRGATVYPQPQQQP